MAADRVWRFVTEFDRRGYPVVRFMVCPECWLAHTECVGRTSTGSVAVAYVTNTLSPHEECHWCERNPTATELTSKATA